MIDLHCHTTYSDGTCSVEEVLEIAKKEGLTQIAITDHNTLEGSLLAHKLSPNNTLVGIEISAGFLNDEVHILGYFPNGSEFESVNYINRLTLASKNVNLTAIIENLNEALGTDITLKEIQEKAIGTYNRTDLVDALADRGIIERNENYIKEGMKKYVGDGAPYNVERDYETAEDVCKAIHDDGGIVVLAHPYNYKKINDIPKLLDGMVDIIDGIECFHPSATSEKSEYLVKYATEHNKIITGGSDFHGKKKHDTFINIMKVDDKYQIK